MSNSTDAWHGLATVAWILARDNVFADAVENAHLTKGEATAYAMLKSKFSVSQIEDAAKEMLSAIASGRLKSVEYDSHMHHGLS